MPIVYIERIISVNSADPSNPAENLLKADNNKKWKCKMGEKQASVILQLKQDVVIDAIDIGNENSAFVEVLVAKSSSPNCDFKVLVVASSLMTLKEAKDGTNTSGVRFFKKTDMTMPTADEKWDKVKIVCTQPFNKHVQYGLSFVVLHTSDDQGEISAHSSTLGRFSLKEEDEEQSVTIGSWFAKRKDPPPPVPPGAAASIRDASTPAGIAQGKNKKPSLKKTKTNTPKNGALKPNKNENLKQNLKPDSLKAQRPVPALNISFGDDDSPADDTDADSTYSPNKDSNSILSDDDFIPDDSDEEVTENKNKKLRRNNKENSVKNSKNGTILNGPTSKRKLNDSRSTKTKVAKVERETKLFGKLLDGVTIVISGYQNPLRGDLRSKACAMGAKYKADWDNTCTHLICAFVNTPKFNQVRRRGKIVKKEWVEECHNLRRRLPWRRFALDINDTGTSSEEEVWEESCTPSLSNTNATIASGVNRQQDSSGSDTEEEIERVRARHAANKPATPTQVKPKLDHPKKVIKPSLNKTMENNDTFGDETDLDSDTESQTANLPLPFLPDFFLNIIFHIACDIDDSERSELQRYIAAYRGSLSDMIDGSVEYVITKLPDIAAEVGENYGVMAVAPSWIWECSDAGKLIPVSDFVL